MSKVYSFRLSDDNPREAQAREVIEAWVEEGHTIRYTLTEALLRLGDLEGTSTRLELSEFLDQIKELLQQAISQGSTSNSRSELSEGFMKSITKATKPGLKFDL